MLPPINKRYRVEWTEFHYAYVEALNDEQAVEKAYELDPETTKSNQSLDSIEEQPEREADGD